MLNSSSSRSRFGYNLDLARLCISLDAHHAQSSRQRNAHRLCDLGLLDEAGSTGHDSYSEACLCTVANELLVVVSMLGRSLCRAAVG